jgi:hypothetical protein
MQYDKLFALSQRLGYAISPFLRRLGAFVTLFATVNIAMINPQAGPVRSDHGQLAVDVQVSICRAYMHCRTPSVLLLHG